MPVRLGHGVCVPVDVEDYIAKTDALRGLINESRKCHLALNTLAAFAVGSQGCTYIGHFNLRQMSTGGTDADISVIVTLWNVPRWYVPRCHS